MNIQSEEKYADKIDAMDDDQALAEMDRLAERIRIFAGWNNLAPKDYAIIAPLSTAAAAYESARSNHRRLAHESRVAREAANARIVAANMDAP